MKYIALLAALLAASPLYAAKQPINNKIQTLGFSCADTVVDVIPLLGRGEDAEHFVAQDIQTELERQHKGSVLTQVECLGEPELKASVIKDNAGNEVLSKMSIAFPVAIQVNVNKQTIEMQVDQTYLAENLEKAEGKKVTQHFVVKKS
ncbi:hypothetical protein [Bowmanella pacifica]|uniref:Uncharacterized protein n=1 Tax=Bowmanella pacifica TaxID=502051 RepID=A0A917YQ62_9ALTE|nr:hypothetical protein [Bowmanella pacifica]GGO63630.1 hypothetical protein GCM10010982_01110 [Bowmanella pacifica]